MRRDKEAATMVNTWVKTVEKFCSDNIVRNDSFHPKQGCLFSCQLDVENMGFKNDGSTQVLDWQGEFCIQMGVIVTRGHNVFVGVNMFQRGEKICRVENFPWENTSNHDSCWRTDGLHLRKFYTFLDKAVEELLSKVTEPNDFSGLNYFMRHVNFAVPVTVDMERSENHMYIMNGVTTLQEFPVVLHSHIRLL